MPARSHFPLMLIRACGLPFSRLAALATDWKTAEAALQVGQAQKQEAALTLQAAFDAALQTLEESPLRTAVYNARKDFYRRAKLPSDHFFKNADKQAALPGLQKAIAGYQNVASECRQMQQAFERQYEDALTQGYACLQAIAGEEQFQRALLFSSHSLLGQLPQFCAAAPEHFSKKDRQTALAVLQYATRMAVKTSPLSRFTSVSIQQAGLPNAPLETYTATPNVALLEAMYAVFLQAPEFYRSLPIALNPSIAEKAEKQYRWLFFNGETESFQEAGTNPLLDHLVELLLREGRQLQFETLLHRLEADVEARRHELESWLLELLDLGFLEWRLPEPGLSPSWCSNLQRYLGFLPATGLIVEAAALLQWLRGAARTMPYQGVSEAQQTQLDTLQQAQRFFEAHEFPMPPIPPEQVFYEDALQAADLPFPPTAPQQLANDLADCWRQRPAKPLPTARAQALAFARETIAPGQSRDFLDFCRAYIAKAPASPSAKNASHRPEEKIGALLQIFSENGQWHAVVNGLYPGGGKLFARWLHHFSAYHTDQFSQWLNKKNETPAAPQLQTPNSQLQTSNSKLQTSKLQFPWQTYFNANFQPNLTAATLAVPGSRIQASAAGEEFLLGNLDLLREGESLVLRDRKSGRRIELTELGLETPENRPPVLQLLWNLGVPYVSLEALQDSDAWESAVDGLFHFRPRQCFQNLVLARAAWSVEPALWQRWLRPSQTGLVFFQNLRAELSELGIPRYFFAQFATAKPQFFDQDSPLLMQLFEKILRQGGGALRLTEMLPLPEHWNSEWQGQRVQELVIEFEV